MPNIDEKNVWAVFATRLHKIFVFGVGENLGQLRLNSGGNKVTIIKKAGDFCPGAHPIDPSWMQATGPDVLDSALQLKMFKFVIRIDPAIAPETCAQSTDGELYPFDGEGNLTITIVNGPNTEPPINVPMTFYP